MTEQIKFNEKNPLVSIIITCWGSREYIREAIESALTQRYEPIEVIVLEDCGNDGTYEEAMKIKDPRLRVFRNEKNLGNYTNKNHGLEYSHGMLLKYLDGDDVLEKNCLDYLVEYWRRFSPTVGLVFGQYTIIDQYGKHLATPHAWGITGRCNGIKVLDVITRAKASGSRFGNTTPCLIERKYLELTGGFPQVNCWSGDQETFFKLLCVTDVAFVSESVARFRVQPGSIGHTIKHDIATKDNIAMIERLYDFFQKLQGLPGHLTDPQFIKEWKVWVNSHFILSNYQYKIIGRPNRFDAIKAIYEEKGLGPELRSLISKRLLPDIFGIFTRKLRKSLNLPIAPPLFTKKQAFYISRAV